MRTAECEVPASILINSGRGSMVSKKDNSWQGRTVDFVLFLSSFVYLFILFGYLFICLLGYLGKQIIDSTLSLLPHTNFIDARFPSPLKRFNVWVPSTPREVENHITCQVYYEAIISLQSPDEYCYSYLNYYREEKEKYFFISRPSHRFWQNDS